MKTKKLKPKMYVIRKHIMARSLKEALKLDKTTTADEVWISEEWKNGTNNNLAEAIGFSVEVPEEEE